MIGLTLGRYFLKRHLVITFWFMIGIALLILVVDFTELAKRASALPAYSALAALGMSAMRTLMVLQITVPFIALFSAMTTLISLNRKYELVVARAAGVSAWQFLLPISFGAFLAGLFTVFVINPMGAAGAAKAEEIEAGWRAGKSNALAAASLPWFRQRSGGEDTIIGANSVLEAGSDLRAAVFFRIGPDGAIAERIDAERALLKTGNWELTGVSRRMADGTRESLPKMLLATELSPDFVAERLAMPETVSVFGLSRMIESAKAYGFSADKFRMQFHSVTAIPALLVAMTLIAATVSLKFVRFGQSASMIVGGILAGFLLYVVSVLVKAFGSAGFVHPFIAAWFPVVVAMFFGVSFLLHKEDG